MSTPAVILPAPTSRRRWSAEGMNATRAALATKLCPSLGLKIRFANGEMLGSSTRECRSTCTTVVRCSRLEIRVTELR